MLWYNVEFTTLEFPLVLMLSSPIISLFLPLRLVCYPDQTGLGTGIGRTWLWWRASWWLEEATLQPHCQAPLFHKDLSFSPHAAHPCVTVPVSCADHTSWHRLLSCTGARLAWLCWYVLMVWRGIRAQLSDWRSLLWVSFLCWKNKALLFLYSCLLGSCLFLCLGPVCLSALLSSSFNLRFPSSSVSVSLSTMCSAAWLQDCFWRCQVLVLGNAELHHLQDISLLQMSKSIQKIKWSSICEIIYCYQGICFPSGDLFPISPANWPELTLNSLSWPLYNHW